MKCTAHASSGQFGEMCLINKINLYFEKEPTVDEINTCIEKNQTKGMTISRDSGCALLSSSDQSEALPKAPQRTNGCPDLPEAAAPKRTCSEDSNDSAKSKESQATTGM